MPTIVTCECGARVRMPELAEGQTFRCPRCKTQLTAPATARIVAAQGPATGKEALCPICQSLVVAGEATQTCPECDQIHHLECWDEVGGCSTYGCPEAPPLEKETPTSRPLTAWGDTKKCPACGEMIKSIALRCRYCKTEFDTVDPLTAKDLRRGVRREETQQSLRTTVVTLFILTAIGCLAPLMLVVNLCVFLPKRKELARAGPFYQVFAFAAVALSVLYTVLILLFAVAAAAGAD